ncbi:MAG: class I SAM-dependent methyltransferase, partial [Candidatus Electrothrix sp. AR3]|nr:class I SAM-dependent methyltransferase [Candidatus Electrothrix sp. AR3]
WALPLASRCRRVTALDFSAMMLEIFEQRAEAQVLKNISARKLSWEDDWAAQGIRSHDLVIASRSLMVPNLQLALEKLNHFARRLVCVTDKVRHGPFDPDAFAAVGRTLEPGPDYIYTINLLHQMGYLPKVDYIHLEEELLYSSFTEAIAGWSWMFHDLHKEEEQKLEEYVRSITEIQEDGTAIVRHPALPIWAFISWEPTLSP